MSDHPKADGLRAAREARFGHLQATAEPAKIKPAKAPAPKKAKKRRAK